MNSSLTSLYHKSKTPHSHLCKRYEWCCGTAPTLPTRSVLFSLYPRFEAWRFCFRPAPHTTRIPLQLWRCAPLWTRCQCLEPVCTIYRHLITRFSKTESLAHLPVSPMIMSFWRVSWCCMVLSSTISQGRPSRSGWTFSFTRNCVIVLLIKYKWGRGDTS